MSFAELIGHSYWIHRNDLSFIVSPEFKRVGVVKPLGNQLHRDMIRTPETGVQKPRVIPP